MKYRQLTTAIVVSLLISPAFAVRDIDPASISVDKIHELPIKKISAVESNGQIMFISSDGRFVITGQIFDLWQRKSLDTMEQVEQAVSQVSMNSLGIDISALNSVSMGEGTKQVTIFVDPLCGACSSLLKTAQKLGDTYTFQIVVVPALGDGSNQLAQKVSCSNKEGDVLNALINKNMDDLEASPPCDSSRYQKTLIVAQMLGVDGVPFIIDANGQPHRGVPADLRAWLER